MPDKGDYAVVCFVIEVTEGTGPGTEAEGGGPPLAEGV